MPALIYVITNTLSGKMYVGQTWKTIEQRWKRHRSDAFHGRRRKSMPILHALAKYGVEAFEIRELEALGDCSQEHVDTREIYWAQHLNTMSPNGYNLRVGKGRGIMSDETRAKLSVANTGRKASPETRRKLSEAHKGYKWSPERTAKASARAKGIPLDPSMTEKAIKACMKTYTIRDPQGNEVIVTNMAAFCREMGLNRGLMASVVTGSRKHHRGWTFVSNHGHTNPRPDA